MTATWPEVKVPAGTSGRGAGDGAGARPAVSLAAQREAGEVTTHPTRPKRGGCHCAGRIADYAPTMLNLCEGSEVLLKTGEVVIVASAFSSWRGERWVGNGVLHGREIRREFGEDDVRAVLGQGRSGGSAGTAGYSDATLF